MKTRINLLPWRQALAERRRKYWLAFLLAFACAALAAVWLADQVIDQAIDRQVTRNDHLGKDIAGLDSRIKTIDDLQEQSQQLAQRMKVVQDLHDARSSGAQLLDQLARAVPDGVHLHEVVAKGDTVSISGSAESSQDIAQLMRRLEAAQGAHSTRLQQVRTDGARGNNEFQLMVRQGESSGAQP
ncbi:PilN domain-containing protein [Pseudomonas marginalis]|uniref:PilN domain-containing protein n=1 Tax=Pseudomonas marginalis TaxID=298 RepID=UPI0005FBCD8B|nr:PilN domain-containing protein [Pseudomonas marginalis]KJZ55471.1 fimbriae biosynthesis protein [Pseudomonas marginalis]KJZ62230.1 fimbriae biosynthesis protein [Pseudomonas marginalis]WPN24206.1 PilN domain-containing protein [Pseudomonas marginalis]